MTWAQWIRGTVARASRRTGPRGSRLDRLNLHARGLRRNLHSAINTDNKRKGQRGWKNFSVDDASAVVSWVLMSHALWIALSTTTFASGVIYIATSTASGQEWLATRIGELVTRNMGTRVIFENANIVPQWSSRTIQFSNVFVSRRPGITDSSKPVSKGSQLEAMERAKLGLSDQLLISKEDFDRGNYTQFDLTIDKVEISLSFLNWLNGKGILDEVTINGVRGVVDRTHLQQSTVDPRLQRNIHKPGDFEINKFKLADSLVTVYQPNGFRPFQISIINCQLPRLRKHWLLYDFITGDSISGTFDNAMFILQRKYGIEKSYNRFRIDNLDIDHLNAGVVGPFSWITRGHLDLQADIHMTSSSDTPSATSTSLSSSLPSSSPQYFTKPMDLLAKVRSYIGKDSQEKDNPEVQFQVSLRLKNVNAEVPYFNNKLTYKNKALIQPIVAYINSKRTYIPIRCSITKPLEDFSGSWTIYDSYLLQDLSLRVWDSFATYVMDDERRALRVKRVTFWSLHLLLQTILMAMGAIAQS